MATQRGVSGVRDVADVLAYADDPVRERLLMLRRLILDTAAETPGVGPIEETLKWGQPSYLTSESGSGSTIRIAAAPPGRDYDCAMYFICHTDLVERFERVFGDELTYDGKRALLFAPDEPLPLTQLRECVAMALTYHQTNRRS